MPNNTTKPLRFIGIGRSHQYSPNSVARDSAILCAVAQELYNAGYSVTLYHEDNWSEVPTDKTYIFSMARQPQTLQRLRTYAPTSTCLNPPEGVALCSTRAELMAKLAADGIPQPNYCVLSLDQSIPWEDLPAFPLWIKHAKGYSQHTHDVVFVPSADALETALVPFRQRDYRHVVLSEHIEGDLIKFYGVANTPFFHITYATSAGSFSKFGWEEQNGAPQHYAFDKANMQQQLSTFGARCGIYMFGGDAIVTADGRWQIIDFNDWPSYGVCRQEAAEAIATLLLGEARSKYAR